MVVDGRTQEAEMPAGVAAAGADEQVSTQAESLRERQLAIQTL
jgi:hypothetical protein